MSWCQVHVWAALCLNIVLFISKQCYTQKLTNGAQLRCRLCLCSFLHSGQVVHMDSEDTPLFPTGSPSFIPEIPKKTKKTKKKPKTSRPEMCKKTVILSNGFGPAYWQIAVGLLLAHLLITSLLWQLQQWLVLVLCGKKRLIFVAFACCNLQCATHTQVLWIY